MLAIYIRTTNDKNGNPRRGWVIAHADGSLQDFVDEGYAGRGALAQAGYHLATPTDEAIEVTPGYYQKLRRKTR